MDRAMKEKSYSQRWACTHAGIVPCVYRRGSKRPADAEFRARMKVLASKPRRISYRRQHVPLKREGWEMS